MSYNCKFSKRSMQFFSKRPLFSLSCLMNSTPSFFGISSFAFFTSCLLNYKRTQDLYTREAGNYNFPSILPLCFFSSHFHFPPTLFLNCGRTLSRRSTILILIFPSFSFHSSFCKGKEVLSQYLYSLMTSVVTKLL